MAKTVRFKHWRDALRWRKRHPKRRIVGVAITSKAPKPHYTKRQLIVRFCHWAVAHEPQIHYAEVRPIPQVKHLVLPKLPFTTDCSGFTTMAFQYAGAADPNGNNYNGEGYTGTLLGHLKHIPISLVKPGDVVIYGCKSIKTGHHAAVVIAVHSATHAGIVTVSHGSESGPMEITVAEEAKYQPDGDSGVVFLEM